MKESSAELFVSAASKADPVSSPKMMCGDCPSRKVGMKINSSISEVEACG